jgi:hypothetical protein
MTGSVRTAGVSGKQGRPQFGVKRRRMAKDVKKNTTEARKLLKTKDRAEFVSQKRTDFGVEKALFLAKKRSFLTLKGAISSLLHAVLGDLKCPAEARQGLDKDRGGEGLPYPPRPDG